MNSIWKFKHLYLYCCSMIPETKNSSSCLHYSISQNSVGTWLHSPYHLFTYLTVCRSFVRMHSKCMRNMYSCRLFPTYWFIITPCITSVSILTAIPWVSWLQYVWWMQVHCSEIFGKCVILWRIAMLGIRAVVTDFVRTSLVIVASTTWTKWKWYMWNSGKMTNHAVSQDGNDTCGKTVIRN